MKQTLVLAAILVVYVWADGHDDWTDVVKNVDFDFNFERYSLEVWTEMSATGLLALNFLTDNNQPAGAIILSIPSSSSQSAPLAYVINNCMAAKQIALPSPDAFDRNPRTWTFTRSTEDLHIMVNEADLVHVVYKDDCTDDSWNTFWGKEAVYGEFQTIDRMSDRYRATEKPEDNNGDNNGENNGDNNGDGDGPDVECEDDERRCDDGEQCVQSRYWCDGSSDCDDGSDEGDHCATHECEEGYRKCDDGLQCILSDYWCGVRQMEDCNDGSDEGDHCNGDNGDGDNNGDGDGDNNGDGDGDGDETETETETEECPDGRRRCDDGVQCIPRSFWCDNAGYDCDDESDEGDHCDYGVDCSDESNMYMDECMSAARQSHVLNFFLILVIAALQILGF